MNRTSSTCTVLLLIMLSISASGIFETAKCYPISFSQKHWTELAPMNLARSDLGAAAVAGKIYALGGTTRSGGGATIHGDLPYQGGVVATNEEYNPDNGTWTYKQPMPTARAGFAIAIYQDKVYCIGGCSDKAIVGTNEVYNPATDRWETKTAMPTPRTGLCANVVDDKIYLIGGFITSDSSGIPIHLDTIEVYDPATDSWTTKTPIPTPVSLYSSGVIDDKIYIISDIENTPDQVPAQYTTLNQVYDPQNDSWSKGPSLPSGMWNQEGAATAGWYAPKRAYVLGQTYTIYDNPLYTAVYYFDGNNWVCETALPTGRECFAVAILNDELYAVGGQTYTGNGDPLLMAPITAVHATVEKYTPTGWVYTKPSVSFLSTANATYYATDVPLVFSLNRHVDWMGYSLDGAENITIEGNSTVTGMSEGYHTVTVYVNNTFGDCASQSIDFTVAVVREEIPAFLTIATVVTIVAAIAGTLILYRQRNRR
jgi:N-acetylneuraminic acid mutarotase